MNNKVIHTIPDAPSWVSVYTGVPRKEVARVLVRTSSGDEILGTYSVRGKTWTQVEDGRPIKNVVAWKLVQNSFEPLPKKEDSEPNPSMD